MKRIIIIKKVLGTLISLNLLPVICGIIQLFDNSNFLEGFASGYIINAIVISTSLIIILIMWLFGFFEIFKK